MKKNDFNKMTTDELNQELMNFNRENFNLRMQIRTGQLTRFHLIKEAKRNIARVKTILRQKELMGSKNE